MDALKKGKHVYCEKPMVQKVEEGHNATFGLRACGPTQAGNISYFEKRIVSWDPEGMKLGAKA